MQLSNLFISLAVFFASTSAVPLLSKRIAQTIIDSVQNWENACDAANGGQQCNPIAVNASSALLAAADPCAQQDAGDIMVNVAKNLGNNTAMIIAAQIFVQQPRNSPNSVAVNYCQRAPQNPELNGLFQCQFLGVNEQQFANGQSLGGHGTFPFGMAAAVNPPGSCPAHNSGPIPDGVQLSSLVSTPGTPANSTGSNSTSSAGSPSASASNSTTSSPPSVSASNSTSGSNSCSASNAGDTSFPPAQQSGTNSSSTSAPAPTGGSTNSPIPSAPSSLNNSTAASPTPTSSPAASSGNSGSFQLSNGQSAQNLNAGFANLTANSPCNESQDACVNGGFAQCVGGKFAITQCAGGTQCFALPLVNKAGTSIACTTESDATSRIAVTGATGGITGSS